MKRTRLDKNIFREDYENFSKIFSSTSVSHCIFNFIINFNFIFLFNCILQFSLFYYFFLILCSFHLFSYSFIIPYFSLFVFSSFLTFLSYRHESRRIDNQLRGRAGRQGDPGGTRFFLSLEDDIFKIFGADKMSGIINRISIRFFIRLIELLYLVSD